MHRCEGLRGCYLMSVETVKGLLDVCVKGLLAT